MTAKEAVESLMSKDPKSSTIRSLKEQGLLEEILYPEGRPQKKPRRDYSEGGREGGRSVRSIASQKKTNDGGESTFQSFVNDIKKDSESPSKPTRTWNTGSGLREAGASDTEFSIESVDRYVSTSSVQA
jgi:hypothetical protein